MPCLTGSAMSEMDEIEGEEAESSCQFSATGLPLTQLRTDLLDFLCSNEKAYFKSQQKDDPELPQESKRKIAEELLDRSPAQFLSRFGQCLEESHLKYFTGEASLLKSESYEIGFRLKELERFFCKATHDVDVKNRRYDALQKMLADGNSYFSEDEMRQRNPYLYEQLVGQYLTEEERKEREMPDLENITFVNLMLMKMSRDETKELQSKQEKEESGIQSDSSLSGEEEEDVQEEGVTVESWNERGTWGETTDDVTKIMDKRKINDQRKKKKKKKSKSKSTDGAEAAKDISDEERLLLMDEFVSTMYNSFIDGRDADFDYSQVDSNPAYDCIAVRERDEEEKYFDAETPEDEEMDVIDDVPEAPTSPAADKPELPPPLPPPPSLAERRKAREEEEDTLDAFMKTVEATAQTSDLTAAFRNLSHQSRIQPLERSRVVKKPHVIKINLKRD